MTADQSPPASPSDGAELQHNCAEVAPEKRPARNCARRLHGTRVPPTWGAVPAPKPYVPHPIHPEYGPCDGFAAGECAECQRVFAIMATDLTAARELLASIPQMIRDAGKPGPGGIDITGGIPTTVYVGIGRDHFVNETTGIIDQYELARVTAAQAREDAAAMVEFRIGEAVGELPPSVAEVGPAKTSAQLY